MTYTFFAGFVIVQFFMLLIGLGGCRIFAHISKLSDAVLIPCIFVLCVVGSFAINNSFVDVVIMFIFGIMGYLMRKLGLNTAGRRPRPYFRADRRKRPPQKPDSFGQ